MVAQRVTVVHWNPRKTLFGLNATRTYPLRGRVNNFGDLLGPLIVSAVLDTRPDVVRTTSAEPSRRLLSVGSILHLANSGDTVWGSGRNGKIPSEIHRFTALDVRAVRGPLTRRFLERERGIAVPPVYGDPALLLPVVLPESQNWTTDPQFDVTVVPNLNDARGWSRSPRVLLPTSRVDVCLKRIASSRFVTGSSLHAVIVAEALGIPARAIASENEEPFKYLDYYEGTGRVGVKLAASVDEALDMGGVEPGTWDPAPLVEAFPWDLWAE